MSGAQAELPRYRSHKTVWALQIASIAYDTDRAAEAGEATDGSAMITPTDTGYAPFQVDKAYVDRHMPRVGGYYVVYEDGYKSFSPAEAFEGGYTRV